jgi:glutathione S-transferase
MATPRLITIPISHFCEKARWGLERAGIDYVEERHLQGFHHWYARRAGKGLTVPVLVLPDGRTLDSSSAILQWVDQQTGDDQKLYPPEIASRVKAVEHWLDVTLGPNGRAWMYSFMLQLPELAGEYGVDGVPRLERRAFPFLFGALKPYLKVRTRLSGTSWEIEPVVNVFDEVAGRLEDGRPFLYGDRFTAADLAFGALSAAVLLPAGYGVELPPLDRLPAEMRSQIEQLRDHAAGQYALRLYEQRRAPAAEAQPAATA